MEVVAEGWRTGPTATLLVISIEFVKLLLPFWAWRASSHVIVGWILSTSVSGPIAVPLTGIGAHR
jgi:hypothetical protein